MVRAKRSAASGEETRQPQTSKGVTGNSGDTKLSTEEVRVGGRQQRKFTSTLGAGSGGRRKSSGVSKLRAPQER